MHATEREHAILELIGKRGFISFRDLEKRLDASPATLRRDLERLARDGKIARVHGGAKLASAARTDGATTAPPALAGVPLQQNLALHAKEKRAIGRAAAALCANGEAIMIDGGSTTLQMCAHLDGLGLQVLTNSLPIVSALLPHSGTRVLIPGGAVFREQNIILSPTDDDGLAEFHAPKLFMGAAALGERGVMQADPLLVAAERRLIERADELILLVDSSKFDGPSGNVVCALEDVDTVVTDGNIGNEHRTMLRKAGVRLVVA